MSGYTPAPHESRARFIAGSIDLIQRRDGCTIAEAEETAIGEWERWMEWHNVRVRRGVVAEEPEWEYGIKCPPMDVAWLGTRESVEATLARWADAGAPLSEGQGVFRRIKQGPWVPVKQEGAE